MFTQPETKSRQRSLSQYTSMMDDWQKMAAAQAVLAQQQEYERTYQKDPAATNLMKYQKDPATTPKNLRKGRKLQGMKMFLFCSEILPLLQGSRLCMNNAAVHKN